MRIWRIEKMRRMSDPYLLFSQGVRTATNSILICIHNLKKRLLLNKDNRDCGNKSKKGNGVRNYIAVLYLSLINGQ